MSATESIRRPARSLITAARLPDPPKLRTGNPFEADGDVVVDCDVPGCGWHAMGARPLVKRAWDEHYRAHHGSDRVAGVLLINNPRGRL